MFSDQLSSTRGPARPLSRRKAPFEERPLKDQKVLMLKACLKIRRFDGLIPLKAS